MLIEPVALKQLREVACEGLFWMWWKTGDNI